ncbi:glycosyltransferase [Litorivicinus lipolyticus]|uniref:Glycosyltransferase n=1 Tax=Litorivicinus lipolyticus TaxID=418701 RepID=A0A5Q2Q5Y6_9GAMM|nr:glycosyltransferase family 4 protein [Litorivicinus lipolyticus]QGG79078.1 glycosyltransferase [Litorivicinus lipolyticus]
MRILFLSFYYAPDLSAGSFRNTALVAALTDQLPSGSQIDVITTRPSRYASFNIDAPQNEELDIVTVQRIALPGHKSGMFDQSRAFIAFAREAVRLTKSREYDLVYASSSRLMTAVLGAYIARKKRVPLYLDIRDIFVDTIKDVLSSKAVWALKPLFSVLEKWAVRRAQKVNLVSGGFRQYFESRYPGKHFSFFTNGIDQEFIAVLSDVAGNAKADLPEVVYAGNFGEGQGLHSIIPFLAKHFDGRLKFKLLGDGGRKSQLEAALRAQQVTNVELLAPVNRSALIEIYRQADVLFLHLNDYDAFLKVLPSKIFEYAAVGKPIWAGVSGFAAEFLHEHVTNAAVFPPCDVQRAIETFETLELQTQPRAEFSQIFSRESIMQNMVTDILRTIVPKA